MRARRALLTAVAAVGVVSAFYASYCRVLIWSGNFHTVEEGQLYRSGPIDQ